MTATITTTYPFSDTLTTKITAKSAFTYYVRIPSWVSKGTLSVNGRRASAVKPDKNGLHAVRVSSGTTTLVLNLPAEITIGKQCYTSRTVAMLSAAHRITPSRFDRRSPWPFALCIRYFKKSESPYSQFATAASRGPRV